jgi:hypothetical protein
MALLEFRSPQGNHPPGSNARGMGRSWLCQEEVIHIDECVFPLGGFQAPVSPGNGANPCLSGSTVRPGDAGNGTLPAGRDADRERGPTGEGADPPLPFPANFPLSSVVERCLSGSFIVRGNPAFPPSRSSCLQEEGGCRAAGTSLPGWICRVRRYSRTGYSDHLPRTAQGILKETFQGNRLYPFPPSIHSGTSAPLPYGGSGGGTKETVHSIAGTIISHGSAPEAPIHPPFLHEPTPPEAHLCQSMLQIGDFSVPGGI